MQGLPFSAGKEHVHHLNPLSGWRKTRLHPQREACLGFGLFFDFSISLDWERSAVSSCGWAIWSGLDDHVFIAKLAASRRK
jgi:hypothetical protein